MCVLMRMPMCTCRSRVVRQVVLDDIQTKSAKAQKHVLDFKRELDAMAERYQQHLADERNADKRFRAHFAEAEEYLELLLKLLKKKSKQKGKSKLQEQQVCAWHCDCKPPYPMSSASASAPHPLDTHVRAHTHARAHTRTRTHTDTHTHACARTHTHTRTHAHIPAHTRAHHTKPCHAMPAMPRPGLARRGEARRACVEAGAASKPSQTCTSSPRHPNTPPFLKFDPHNGCFFFNSMVVAKTQIHTKFEA